MIVIHKHYLNFDINNIYFANLIDDVGDCDGVEFCFTKIRDDVSGFTRQEVNTSIIDLSQSEEQLWKKMDRKSCRNPINRALKSDIKIKKNKQFDEFYHINKEFVHKKGFGLPLSIGLPNIDEMEKYGTLFLAEYNGEILCGQIYLTDGSDILLWMSASNRLNSNITKARLIGDANRLLHWEVIRYAKGERLKEFDWGGLWSEEIDKNKQGINSFKLSFGGEIATRYSYLKIYSKSYNLIKLVYELF
ncbi:MAG: GNAT family N-acetyltransferase [Methanothrix sp.]